jgi:hypothetical protein
MYIFIGITSFLSVAYLLLEIGYTLATDKAMPWEQISTIAIVTIVLWGVIVPVCRRLNIFAKRN